MGHESIVQILLGSGLEADVNWKDDDGQSPLTLAAKKGHEAIVRLLLEKTSIALASNDSNGWIALSWALREGHESIGRLFLESGLDIDVNSKEDDSHSLLVLACQKGYQSDVSSLIEKTDIDINSKGEDGWTALSWACGDLKCDESIIHLLLGPGLEIDVNSKEDEGRSALILASWRGHEAAIRLLLERQDIDVNLRDNDGQTALWTASERGYEAVVRLLLERDDIFI
jgi:ankyrin repeat protein